MIWSISGAAGAEGVKTIGISLSVHRVTLVMSHLQFLKCLFV